MSVLDTLRERRAKKVERITVLAEIEDRNLTEDEDGEFRSLTGDVKVLDERIAELTEMDSRADTAAEQRAKVGVKGTTERATGGAVVTNESQVYTRESASEGVSWFADAYRSHFRSDPAALGRLQRYAQENEVEKRDVGTGAFGALIPPQYLIDMFAPIARAGRPTANVAASHELPDEGMTLNIPRGTTGTATAVQATENTGVQETDFDETTLAVPVVTIAGQQDMSRQSLERGRGNDEIIFADLVADYAVKLNVQLISGSGSSGQHLGILNTAAINAVTYTDATPTVAEVYPKLADALQQINTNRFLPATVWLMHPRRWGWFTAAVDSTGRPLVGIHAPMNPVGVGQAAEYGQVVGEILGVPVVTDASIPTNLGAGTNEDVIVGARAADLHLWEQNGGMPAQLKFEETQAGSLTVKLVVYGYSGFTAGRYPKAVATIGGTGLITPTF